MDLLRKTMANVAKALSDDANALALLENGLVGVGSDERFYLGENATVFCHNMFAQMADAMIQNRGMPKSMRARMIKQFSGIAPIAFERIYKQFRKLLDHSSAAWDGPMVMVLFMAEPSRDPCLDLLKMAELFEGFQDLKPVTERNIH